MFRSMTRLAVVAVAATATAFVGSTAAWASPGMSPSDTETRSDEVGTSDYTDCAQWEFGAWDHPGGQWHALCWGGTIECGEWLDLYDVEFPGGGDWRDRIESIQNKTSAVMALDGWDSNTEQWNRLWTANPGDWGDLPIEVRNSADRIIRVC